MNLDKIEQEDIKVLKHKQADLQKRLDRMKITPIWVLSFGIVGFLIALAMYLGDPSLFGQANDEISILKALPLGIFGAFVGIISYIYIMFFLSFSLRPKLREVEYRLAKLGADELQEKIEEDFFNKLIKINFKYLDQYYLQTQEQANKSFLLSAGAAITGLAIITTGIVMMFMGITEPAYVTASAGVLSEFIAAVFFYLYNKTILKMSDYHQKLVITQNVSLALKISDDLPDDEQKKSKVFLIEKLTDNVNNLLANVAT